jgi:hypothetical protein
VSFKAFSVIKNPDAKKKFIMGNKVGGFYYTLKDPKETKINTDYTDSGIINVPEVKIWILALKINYKNNFSTSCVDH